MNSMATRPTATQPQEYVILGLLMKGGEHGYRIHQRFASGPGRVWYTGMSQLYALLKSLEARGYVASSVEPQERRPAKKVFSLTPDGRKAFLKWVREPVTHIRDMRLELLAKLVVMKELRLPGIEKLLGAQRKACRQLLEEARKRVADGGDGLDRLISRFRIGQIEAVLGWLEECENYFAQEEVS